jgi:hypothetical protein
VKNYKKLLVDAFALPSDVKVRAFINPSKKEFLGKLRKFKPNERFYIDAVYKVSSTPSFGMMTLNKFTAESRRAVKCAKSEILVIGETKELSQKHYPENMRGKNLDFFKKEFIRLSKLRMKCQAWIEKSGEFELTFDGYWEAKI